MPSRFQEEGLNEVLAAFGAPTEATVRHPEEEFLSRASGSGQTGGTSDTDVVVGQPEAASSLPTTAGGTNKAATSGGMLAAFQAE